MAKRFGEICSIYEKRAFHYCPESQALRNYSEQLVLKPSDVDIVLMPLHPDSILPTGGFFVECDIITWHYENKEGRMPFEIRLKPKHKMPVDLFIVEEVSEKNIVLKSKLFGTLVLPKTVEIIIGKPHEFKIGDKIVPDQYIEKMPDGSLRLYFKVKII